MLDLGWSGRCKFSEEQHWPKNMKQFEGGGGMKGGSSLVWHTRLTQALAVASKQKANNPPRKT